ncbi:hypothetical protein THICB2_240007 [Thiomonas sp. CB2]|nr:hypothetical protein THICB2_240007 [Thiomonas sp. CB2]VDY05556.1 protein of unknown function [Thiomonas sp. Bio17B3]VDY07280.1 protein of unknown function [Thiomonas sp. Sup16B3]VDY13810.1 conserved protein of unknown function [Thiomonas sp. OC7]VDY16990.1 protein of unknown function [Thiomonas sp. CB2]
MCHHPISYAKLELFLALSDLAKAKISCNIYKK